MVYFETQLPFVYTKKKPQCQGTKPNKPIKKISQK